MDENDNGKPKFLMAPSLQISRLTELLAKGPLGKAYTRGELKAAIGLAFTDQQLMSARRRCLNTHGLQWEFCDRNGILNCLSDPERVSVGESNMGRVHRLSKRSLRKLATVNADGLANGDKIRLNTLVAQHGTLAAFSTAKTTKAIEAKNVTTAADLPKLLEAMK